MQHDFTLILDFNIAEIRQWFFTKYQTSENLNDDLTLSLFKKYFKTIEYLDLESVEELCEYIFFLKS